MTDCTGIHPWGEEFRPKIRMSRLFSLSSRGAASLSFTAHIERAPLADFFNILLMEQGVSLNRLRNGIGAGFRELVMEFHAVV